MSQSPLPTNKQLVESDILNLISIQARENRFIEFKSEYLPDNDGGKKKFLQSVASFANARGGDLLLGVQEQEGVAAGITPLTKDPDQSRLQILDLIRVHLRPALGGVQVISVAMTGGHVFVIRIPKSWAGPHMLTYGDERRFYIRGDGGKRPMDYEDVRDGFLGGENIAARIRNFRMERCSAILNGETPRPLTGLASIVLHIVPFESLAARRLFDVRELKKKASNLVPLNSHGYSPAFDMDGVFSYWSDGKDRAASYSYIFRNGAIEALDTGWLAPYQPGQKTIPYGAVEQGIIDATREYFQLIAELQLLPPYAFFLTLLNVKDYYMPTKPYYMNSGNPIKCDHLFVPEIVFDSVPEELSTALFPVFNSVWHACGWSQSLNYDEAGNWNPKR